MLGRELPTARKPHPPAPTRHLSAGGIPRLRHRQRQHHRLLGQQQQRKSHRTHRHLQGRRRRRLHSCAIASDDTIDCWGEQQQLRARPPHPRAPTRRSPPATTTSCAIASDNTIDCWGARPTAAGHPPEAGTRGHIQGRQRPDINYSLRHRQQRHHHLLGLQRRGNLLTARTVQGRSRPAGSPIGHSCAIASNDTITCWGWDNYDGQATAPTGTYKAVTSRATATAALSPTTTPSPAGATSARAGRSPPKLARHKAIAATQATTTAPSPATTPSPAGAATRTSGPSQQHPQAPTRAVATGIQHSCAIHLLGQQQHSHNAPQAATRPCAIAIRRRHHHLLGQQHSASNPPPSRLLQGCRGRSGPQLRHRQRRHHHLLGQQHLRPSHRAHGHLQGHRSRNRQHNCAIADDDTIDCWGRRL